MDKCSSDAEFDSYWDYEAKNKNRNRIRVGRQYQATIPPLLKPGERDGRKSEDLEILKWKPDKINDQEVDQYLSMAKAIGPFAKAIDNSRNTEKSVDNSLQTAIKGLSDFVTSHHPCHHDAGCKVPGVASEESTSKASTVNDWSPSEAHLFAQALEACGKNFCAIKKEFLPWKPVRSIIEYYYNGKGDKPDHVSTEVPLENSSNKEDKINTFASCSHDTLEKVELPDTKEEMLPQNIEAKADLQETSEQNKIPENCKVEPIIMESTHCESTPVSSTVGSLKFFLGGRLVLKLNAQQASSSGTKCQWVQSNDTPKHPLPVKRMKHRKKVFQDTSLTVVSENQKLKKKIEDQSSNPTSVSDCDKLVVKKAKLKSERNDTETEFSLLCSSSWTPPVADGQDSVELDDGSSKTSEGYISPVLLNSRCPKIETKSDISMDIKSYNPNDLNELKFDPKHSWIKTEPLAIPCSSQSESTYTEDIIPQNVRFKSEKNSPKPLEDAVHSQEVLNHKSALSNCKPHAKSSCFIQRTAHSSSPAKAWNRWSSTSTDYSDKVKLSPGFHSPNSLTCSTSSESSVKDFVLDLSSRPERCSCENQDMSVAYENCCQMFHGECTENCSSSEESIQTSYNSNNDSLLISKSSNSVAYSKDMEVTTVKTAKETETVDKVTCAKLQENSSAKERCDISTEKTLVNDARENCAQCPYYYNPSSSSASPKCTEDFPLKEHVCNKDDGSVKSTNHSSECTLPETENTNSKKPPPWFGTPVTSFLQFYPQCYPYYLTYGVTPTTVTDSSVGEIPLDLSAAGSGNTKDEKPMPEDVPENEADVSKKTAEAVERGMLYQLLKNKVTK